MAKYVYPAIFTKTKNGYVIDFPNMQNCSTQGRDLYDAMYMANDVLCLILYWKEKDGEDIPPASDIRSIKTKENEFATYISCDTDYYEKWYREHPEAMKDSKY